MKKSLYTLVFLIIAVVLIPANSNAQVTFSAPELVKVCGSGIQPLPMIYRSSAGTMYYGCNNQIFDQNGSLFIPEVHYHFNLVFAGNYIYETFYQRLENQLLRVQTNSYPPSGKMEVLNTADYDTPGVVSASSMKAGKYYIFEGEAGVGKQAIYYTNAGAENVKVLLDAKITSSRVEFDNAAMFSVKRADGAQEIIFTQGIPETTVVLKEDNCNIRGGRQGATEKTYYYFCSRNVPEDPEGFFYEFWQTDGTAQGTRQITLPESNGFRLRELIGEVGGKLIFIASELKIKGSTPVHKLLALSADKSFSTSLIESAETFSAHGQAKISDNRKSAFIPLRFSDSQIPRTEIIHTDGTYTGTVRIFDSSNQDNVFSASIMGMIGKFAFLNLSDEQHGTEIWVSDGTVSGTKILADIVPGAESSHPEIFVAVGNVIYFRALVDNETYGIYKFNAVNCTVEECGEESVETGGENNSDDGKSGVDTGTLQAPGKLKVKKRKGYYNFIMQKGEAGALYELVLTMQKVAGASKKLKIKKITSKKSTVLIKKLKAGKWIGKYRIKYGISAAQITKYSAEKKFKIKL